MRRFYEHLWNGMDKGSALRQAKLDLLHEFADQALPVYWAGFTLAGDGGSFQFEEIITANLQTSRYPYNQ